MKGIKIITAVEILAKVKISATLFPAYFELRKAASKIYEERALVTDKFKADWGDELKSFTESNGAVAFTPDFKEAEKAANALIGEILAKDYDVKRFNLTSDVVIDALKDSELNFEQVAAVADVLCNED